MDTLRQDIRYALRSLRGSKAITAVAILSVGLGIGATSSIFSGVDVFMIRPLPFPDSHELVMVWTANRDRGWTTASSSVPDFLDLREESRSLDLAAVRGTGVNLSGGDQPLRLNARRVSPGFFSIVGVQPARGRGFLPDEEGPGAPPAVVISNGLWHRTFGADPEIVGRTVSLDGIAHTVVGVTPPRFNFGSAGIDAWMPLTISGDEPRASRYLQIVGRVRDGFTLEQARAEMSRLARRLAVEYPEANAGNDANVVRLRDEWFDEGFRQGSAISSVAVVFVLLIACANVANLLLARGAAREREIALRSALGAGRVRIVRQLLTESVILALAGGVLGIGLAFYGARGLRSLLPAWFPRVDAIGVDGRVLLFTAVVAVVSGVLFGLAPALQSATSDYRTALGEGGSRGSAGGRGRLRRALVVSEIALAMALLVASGLLVKSFVQMQTADLGFRTDLLSARITLPEAKYPDDEDTRSFYRDLLSRLAGLPGVEAVGGTSVLPTQGNNATYYALEDETLEVGRSPIVSYRSVTPGYLEAMGVDLLAGRRLTEEDAAPDAPRVALVNQRMVERHWPEESPLGARIRFSSGPREIVGVVENTRDFGPEDDPPALVYQPSYELRSMSVVMAGSQEPRALLQPIRSVVQEMDPDQPVYEIQTVASLIQEEIGGYNAMVKILAALGAVALVLSLAGVYGVMAYSVAQRTREVGVRMALGARERDVLGLVIRQGGALAAVGVGAGLLLALVTARGLSFFLVGVSPYDPIPFGATAAVLLVAAVAATVFPARRASRVDPVEALRTE